MLKNIKAALTDDIDIFKVAKLALLTLWGGTAMVDKKGFLKAKDLVKQIECSFSCKSLVW